jgi:hypothetical protein
MIIRAKLSALKEGLWYEYVLRFALGGATTLAAGIIGDIWGPVTGGRWCPRRLPYGDGAPPRSKPWAALARVHS